VATPKARKIVRLPGHLRRQPGRRTTDPTVAGLSLYRGLEDSMSRDLAPLADSGALHDLQAGWLTRGQFGIAVPADRSTSVSRFSFTA